MPWLVKMLGSQKESWQQWIKLWCLGRFRLVNINLSTQPIGANELRVWEHRWEAGRAKGRLRPEIDKSLNV